MDPELESFYIAFSVVNTLPQIVENLGQARGMASGLAARAILIDAKEQYIASLSVLFWQYQEPLIAP
jgi:hypothetical protein